MKHDKPKQAQPGGHALRRGIFKKYLSLTAGLMLVALLVLGCVFLLFMADHFRWEKENALHSMVDIAAEITRDNYQASDYQYLLTDPTLEQFSLLAKETDCTLFLVDYEGRTLLCTEKNCIHSTYSIPYSIYLSCVSNRYYAELGTLNGIYADRQFTVAVPIKLDEGAPQLMVCASQPAAAMEAGLWAWLLLFLITATVVFSLALLTISRFTRNLSAPLVQMAQAADQFARGDFSMRIAVRGDDELAQLSHSFNEMATALSALENSRRSFVANVSHELKTPMTTIGGFIDGMLDGTIPEDKRAHYLQIVSDEVKRLSRMVRAMLAMSRLDAGDMVLRPSVFDVRDIIIQTIIAFEQPIESKELEILGLEGARMLVKADRDLLHQALYNLIENAVKFVEPGGYISVSLAAEGDWVRVEIRNSGKGIPHDELQNVFDRFYKTDRSRSLDKSGVGLGLYIVRSVVALHGGSITVQSKEDEYTAFSFTLPSATAPMRGEAQ